MQVNDTGLAIRLTVTRSGNPLDISSSTARAFVIEKPSGEVNEVTATYVTDGTDGALTYTVSGTDLDEAGRYQIQAKITVSSNIWRTTPVSFDVGSNLS